MTPSQREKKIAELMNTSVDDCRQLLQHVTSPALLCDLLIACRQAGHESRESAVRSRISQLLRGMGVAGA
jgi:hypothetical protein